MKSAWAKGNHNIQLMIFPGQFALNEYACLLHNILSLLLSHNRFSSHKYQNIYDSK